MLTDHIELSRVAPALPLALRTLYAYRHLNRLPWLIRLPAGQGGTSRLVVDWPGACRWFAPRGIDLRVKAAAMLSAETCRLVGVEPQSSK